jgi:hypothetical protein
MLQQHDRSPYVSLEFDWRELALAFAVERSEELARAIQAYWIDREALSEVAARLSMGPHVAKKKLKEGIEHCVSQYLLKYVMKVNSPILLAQMVSALIGDLDDNEVRGAESPPIAVTIPPSVIANTRCAADASV